MVRRCFVLGCRYNVNHEDSRNLFKLPPDTIVRSRLLLQLHFDATYDPPNVFLMCSNHFTPESIIITRKNFSCCSLNVVDFLILLTATGPALIKNPIVKGYEDFDLTIVDTIGTFTDFLRIHITVLGESLNDEWQTRIADDNTSVCYFMTKYDVNEGMKVAKSILVERDMSVKVDTFLTFEIEC